MVNNYLAPGIYMQEISTLPGTVVEVQSAIPAFIGYTEKTRYNGRSLLGVPERIASFKDFEERFGGSAKLNLDAIRIKTEAGGAFESVDSVHFTRCFLLYEAVYMYFANGGGECTIVSTGAYADTTNFDKEPFLEAIEALDAVDDITLLALPEAVLLGESCFTVQQAALAHCARRMNRFAILDTREDSAEGSTLLHWRHTPDKDWWRKGCQEFRDRIGIMNLSYGAAYTPNIIADTPVRCDYKIIRDHLRDADAADSGTAVLSLDNLDPSVKQTIQALDVALLDCSNLMDAVTEGKKALLPGVDRSKMPRRLSDIIRKGYMPLNSDNIGKLTDMYGGLFISLLGLDPARVNAPRPVEEKAENVPEEDEGQPSENDRKDPDKAAGVFGPHPLSTDMARHVADQLKGIVGKYVDLSAEGKDMASLIASVRAGISALPAQAFGELTEALHNLLFADLYEAISKNITRLSDGLYSNSAVYRAIHSAVQTAARVQPPSAAMAGIYASTDRQRGVWKAPANVSIANALGLTQVVTQSEQETLNADSVSGKSINALRSFPGKGYLVWGARTLDGNSLEWRYIPVRRFFLMVEESMRRATTWAVFEPNDANLWAKIKSMLDNYLLQKWKEGALQGAAPGEAYFVNVGLGSTMTEQDILEGRLIVDVGMAVVRPAEFIILRFMHKMQQA